MAAYHTALSVVAVDQFTGFRTHLPAKQGSALPRVVSFSIPSGSRRWRSPLGRWCRWAGLSVEDRPRRVPAAVPIARQQELWKFTTGLHPTLRRVIANALSASKSPASLLWCSCVSPEAKEISQR